MKKYSPINSLISKPHKAILLAAMSMPAKDFKNMMSPNLLLAESMQIGKYPTVSEKEIAESADLNVYVCGTPGENYIGNGGGYYVYFEPMWFLWRCKTSKEVTQIISAVRANWRAEWEQGEEEKSTPLRKAA